jgi:tRNA pseudouridine38-40 synthase
LRNIRLTIQYEGSRYRGWQKLGDSEATIQGKLETLLSRVCGEAVALIGAGRTDAGVHALAQVANFHTAAEISCEDLLAACRAFLPADIAVLTAEEAAERFHARFQARRKCYRYRLDTGFAADVFTRRTAYHVPDHFSRERIREALPLMAGEHDFASFTNRKFKNKSTVRTLAELRLEEAGRFTDFIFIGDGFLHNMARILAGTLLAVGRGEIKPRLLPGVFSARDRQAAGPMLPPQGLTLLGIEYP